MPVVIDEKDEMVDLMITPGSPVNAPLTHYRIPVLLNRKDGTACGPADILNPYARLLLISDAHQGLTVTRRHSTAQ
jgi:hypothetical protein